MASSLFAPRASRLLASALAISVVASAPAALAEPPSTPSPSAARVIVRSDEPDLVVGDVKTRAVAYGGGHVATGVGWDERCTAPCTFELQPGLRELVFRSPDFLRFEELRIRPGDNEVYVDGGNPAMRTTGTVLGVIGLLAAITGGSLALTRAIVPDDPETGSNSFKQSTGWAVPVMLGGFVALGGGITLSYIGRVKVEQGPGPSPSGRSAQGGDGVVQLSGTF